MTLSRFQYYRWDGTQKLAIDPDELLDQLADRLIDGEDPRWALQRLMREGFQRPDGERMQGLRDMLEKIRQARQDRLQQHDLGKAVDELREALDKIVEQERSTVERRLDEARGQKNEPGEQGQQGQDGQGGQQGEQDGAQGQQGEQSPRGQEGQQGQPGSQSQQGSPSQSGQSQSGQSQSGQSPSDPGQSPSSSLQSGSVPPELMKALEKIAQQHQQKLNELPDRTGQRLKALQDYDFMDQQAAADFKELMERLKQAMLGSFFKDLKQSIQNLTPEALDRIRDMVRDLNKLLQQHRSGENPDSSGATKDFLHKHGGFFPGAGSMQDILDQLAAQMNQMGSLMRSLSSAQRQELAEMMSAALGDDRLRVDLAQLAGQLQGLIPPDSQRYPFSGDQPLGLEEALGLMGEMEGMDRSADQMQSAIRDPRQLDKVDVDELRRFVGDDAAQQFENLKDLAKILKDAGYLEERGGQLKLTARAIRKIGDKALRDIFAQLNRDRAGQHQTERRGARGERADDSKQYEFGDAFHLDLRETLMNGVVREGAGTPVRLTPPDFQVFRTEHSTRAATVLLIDMSRSMIYNGCARAAKRLALALQSLIRGQFPRDAFHVVAFAAMAREIAPDEVAHLHWSEYNQGTNLAHGLSIARQLLGRYPGANRQAIIVTDGEPTAHLLDDGEPFFMHPTHPETTRVTLREALRASRDGVRINTFMIEGGPALEDFVGEMTGLVQGRAFMTDPHKLGEYVLLDYVSQRRKRIA